MITKIYENNTLGEYKYVVILSQYNGHILLSRHKERPTWETQGGHIESGETPLEAAKRELYEESGAILFDIKPLCDYWAGDSETKHGANGMVFMAVIQKMGVIPESEMSEVREFDVLPEKLTYPEITPILFKYRNDFEPLFDIPDYCNWKCIRKIKKGWSGDKKYYIKTESNNRILVRISDIEQMEEKKKEYEIIQKYAKLGFQMSMPIKFGTCDSKRKVYMLLSWVDGKDLEEVLPLLTTKEQYELGKKAGKILKSIHCIPVLEEDIPTNSKKEKKLKQLARYEASNVRISDDETALQYVKKNIDKIWSTAPVYQHGDFHPGNLILTPSHDIGVIDFNRWEVGDPYEEFYKLESFGTEVSIPYCIGQINSYFDGYVPKLFWECLAVYVAHASLYSIKWAEKFGQKEIDYMVNRCMAAFEHYDNFNRVVPSWYRDLQETD